MTLAVGLGDVGAADAAWAGGKAASLGELARAGISVPRAFVVTAGAFGLVMDAIDPSGAVRGADAVLDRVRTPDRPALHGTSADRIVLLQSRPETVWAARSRPPLAAAAPRASDQVLSWLGRPL